MRQLAGQDIIAGADSCLKHGSHIISVTLGKVMRLELGKGTSHRTAMAVGYLRDAENEYTIESTGHDIAGDIVARFSITKLGTRQGFPTFDKLALIATKSFIRDNYKVYSFAGLSPASSALTTSFAGLSRISSTMP